MARKEKRVRGTPSQAETPRTRSKTKSARVQAEESEPVIPSPNLVTPEKKLKNVPTSMESSESEPEVKSLATKVEKNSDGDDGVEKEIEHENENQDSTVKESAEEADGMVNFAKLVGVGEGSDDSDEEGRMETLALSRLPGQVVSEIRNDEPALEKKLADITIFTPVDGNREKLPFWESLSVAMPLEGQLPDSLALDDLKREQRFAELATAAAHIGLDNLRKQKKKFRRPADYFAQMVKTDVQMGKVKAKILHHKERIESAEKRRNNRDIAKNKKKVRSSQLQREQEKKRKAKAEIEAFSRLRKERLKQRAGAGVTEEDGDGDDDFPIELLNIEQLDDQNTFQSHADISSGKKKAWTGKNDKFKQGKRSTKGKRASPNAGGLANNPGVANGKLGSASGIRKPRGTKKRVGRSRRKAGAK